MQLNIYISPGNVATYLGWGEVWVLFQLFTVHLQIQYKSGSFIEIGQTCQRCRENKRGIFMDHSEYQL